MNFTTQRGNYNAILLYSVFINFDSEKLTSNA